MNGLSIQLRVIYALIMREIITRYGRHNLGFVWLFAEPMMFATGIMFIWSIFKGSHGSSIPVLPFALVGYSTILLWRNVASRCTDTIQPNRSLLFHRNVLVMDLFIARIGLEIIGATASFITLMMICITVELINAPEDMIEMMFAWILLAWFSAVLGLIVGCFSEMSHLFHRIWHPVAYFMLPISGSLVMASSMNSHLREALLYVPMVDCAEMLREGYFGSIVHSYYDVYYILIVNTIMTLLGLILVRYVEGTVEGE